MSTTLFPATTVAGTSDEFFVNEYTGPITLIAHGLTGTEEIEVQIRYSDDAYTDVYDYATEEQITLKATRNVIPISIPGYYQLVKPTTSAEVTVSYFGNKY